VAQATAVILRACGLSAELFDKVKRPELDGHHATAPLCGARQNARPFVNFVGLVQSIERPASLKGKPLYRLTEPAPMLR
jgi:hypothetical protein